MPSTTSPNKGYELMADGENIGTWGSKTNANLNIADLNLGGRQTLTLSNVTPINLTTAQARNVIYLCGGVLTANIVVRYPTIGGFFCVRNGTSGAFTLTFNSTGGGTGVVIPQGETRVLYCDGVNVVEAVTLPTIPASPIPAGTVMLFVQTAAPTGWVKQTTFDDYALRLVTGTAGGGGTIAFTTTFAQTVTGAHTLTIAEMPAHFHAGVVRNTAGINVALGSGVTVGSTDPTGGDGSHTHPMDIRVRYRDVIMATKS